MYFYTRNLKLQIRFSDRQREFPYRTITFKGSKPNTQVSNKFTEKATNGPRL